MTRRISPLILMLTLAASGGMAQDSAKAIPASAKVFLSPMSGGFEKELAAALRAKKVPVEIVTDKEKAEFEISGASESKKAGAAKIIMSGSWHSSEQASITVTNLKSGEAVWAYSVNKADSAHGKRSSAEACAKHFKDKIQSKK